MTTELRAVALLNLGIVETWSGQFTDAERHVTEGARLAAAIDRPYIEVACRAYQAFPSSKVSFAMARERGRHALALAERHGLDDRPVLAAAYGALACMAVWAGEFEEGERLVRRGWEVVQTSADPACVIVLHTVDGMLHAGRGELEPALDALTAAVQAQSLLTGEHILATVIAEWRAATQARLGMHDDAQATLAGFSAEHRQMPGFALTEALISLTKEDPAAAMAVLGDVRADDPAARVPGLRTRRSLRPHRTRTPRSRRSPARPPTQLKPHLPQPNQTGSSSRSPCSTPAQLLDVVARHQTAHGALFADAVDLLQGEPVPPSRPRGHNETQRTEPYRAASAAVTCPRTSPGQRSHKRSVSP